MKDFEQNRQGKGLPRVGQTVRSKTYGTLWRVLEKKEVWHNIEPDPKTGDPRWSRQFISPFGRCRRASGPAWAR